MRRIHKALALMVLVLASVAPAARADFRLEDIPEGTKVRVTAPNLGLAASEGTVAMAGHRGLIVEFAGLQRTPVPLPEVEYLEVCRYRSRATFQGAAAGFGLGALVGAYIAVSSETFQPGYHDNDAWGAMVISGAVGAALGAIIGSTMTYESWRPIIWYETDPSAGAGPVLGFTSDLSLGD